MLLPPKSALVMPNRRYIVNIKDFVSIRDAYPDNAITVERLKDNRYSYTISVGIDRYNYLSLTKNSELSERKHVLQAAPFVPIHSLTEQNRMQMIRNKANEIQIHKDAEKLAERLNTPQVN